MWTPQKLFMYAMGGMPFCDKDIDNHCPWLLQWRHPRTNTPVKDYPMKDGAKPTAEEMKPYCGETGDMEDLSQYGDDTVKHLKASIQMTRRILKSRGVIKGTPMKPKRSSNIFEEKKTAL